MPDVNPPPEPELPPEPTEEEYDEYIDQLITRIEQLESSNQGLRDELTTLRSQYDEHSTRHHPEPTPEPEPQPAPEPTPRETHWYYRKLWGDK